MKEPFIRSLRSLAAQNRNVMLLTGDLGYGFFEEFSRDFPGQALNVGVAEQNMIGIATGLALEGKIPYCYSIANFATLRPLEQIRNDACYHRANVNLVPMGAGFSYGQLGISHHATEDLSILRALPDITICSPGDDWECEEAVVALATKAGTGCLRLDKTSAGNTKMSGEVFKLGKARVLRDGSDITLVSTGGILAIVLKAADDLAQVGILCRVISMHTIKPFDYLAVEAAARETGGIITVEEHTVEGGLGGLVAENLLESGVIPACFYRIGLREGFSLVVGTQEYLRERYGMSQRHIVEKVQNLLINKATKSFSAREIAI